MEGIFTGRIRDWSQVPGSRISGPIDLFDRDGASGTQDAFQHIFLGETLKISPSATAKTSNGLEQNSVSSDKQAIGFVSFAYTGGVNAVGYNGIPCTLRNAKSGQYAGVRNFWMVTKGVPKGEAAKFIAWVTSGNSGNQKDHQLQLDRGPLTTLHGGIDIPRPRRRGAGSDRHAELALGVLAGAVLVLIAAMVVTVLVKAWPSFRYNGLSWFGSGGDDDTELRVMREGTPLAGHGLLYFRAWPLIWGTLLTTVLAVVLGLVISTFAAVFLTEFAPDWVRRTLDPVVRLLAAVPSVIYGLIGILALAPWINENLISNSRKQSVIYVVQLNGADLATATLILMVMILPIMVAISANALAAVPPAWREGSAALGVNRWRTVWRVSLRTAWPAIAAATVLATARALGEAVMLAMVSGSRGFAANPLDGLSFLFEPVRPLAAKIFQESEGLTIGPLAHTIYAMGAVLLVSATMLSLAGWVAKQPLKRYGIRA